MLAAEIATAGVGLLETTSFLLERMSSQLLSSNDIYPSGPAPRGFEVGRRAGQNLAENFPKIDHYEGGVAVSIKSTTQVEDSGTFVRNVETWATELRDAKQPLRGRTSAGQGVIVDMRQARGRALLVAIPLEPLPWNPSTVARQLSAVSQRLNVVIRIVPLRGLRGR